MLTLLFSAALLVGQPDSPRRAILLPPEVPSALPPAISVENVPAKSKEEPKANTEASTETKCDQPTGGFVHRLLKAYADEWREFRHPKCEDKSSDNGHDKSDGHNNGNGNGKSDEPPRRAMPSPFESPPFPWTEYQGFPVLGLPVDTKKWPLQTAFDSTCVGNALDQSKVRIYGWVNGSANWSTNSSSNTITSYWISPNTGMLDQVVLRAERLHDTVQRDHIDWGFRVTGDYGTDYRYFTAGGWFSRQLLVHNRLYGADMTEAFVNVYFPNVAQGMMVHIGRWIACPDIETQFAPDN